MRTEIVASLRAQVAALERGTCADPAFSRLPFGLPALDAHLPGRGLALGAVHELFAGGPAVEHGAAPALFAASVLARRPGPVLWIAARCDLYPPALARIGLDPARLVLVRTRHGALRATEEGLRHPGLAGVVCEHEGRLGLTASRRLQLAAEATRAPSAAATRWRITGLPSPPPLPHAPDVPGLGRPLWRLELLRCRGAEAASFVVEAPDAQGRLAVPAHMADRPLAPAWPRRVAGAAALGHPRA